MPTIEHLKLQLDERHLLGVDDGTPNSSCGRTESCKLSIYFQFSGEFLWITSEAFWILLIPQVAFPTAAAAFLCICKSTALDFKASRRLEWWFPQFMQGLWLLVNFIWMAEELLWDEPDKQTPWKLTPIAGKNEGRYKWIQDYCIAGFFSRPFDVAARAPFAGSCSTYRWYTRTWLF